MGDKLNSTDMNQEEDARNGDNPKLHGSLTNTLESPITCDSIAGQAGPLTEVRSFPEQISSEDTELSSADISVNVFPHKTAAACVKYDFHNKAKTKATRAVSFCDLSVEKDQPKPQCALLPCSTEASTVFEMSESFTSFSRSQDSLKTSTDHTEPGGADLCAAILLACLFCHPLDCVLATLRGFNACAWSLCSSLCGCEPTAMQPLLGINYHCDLCGCLGVRCFLCDCPICDVCLQATECLDLAMEISQMLYH